MPGGDVKTTRSFSVRAEDVLPGQRVLLALSTELWRTLPLTVTHTDCFVCRVHPHVHFVGPVPVETLDNAAFEVR